MKIPSSETLSSNDKIQSLNSTSIEPILARLAHMYKSHALHSQGRSTTPLPLSAGKQQTRELTPSKINIITVYKCFYQHCEVGGIMPHMEHPILMST